MSYLLVDFRNIKVERTDNIC